MKINKNFILAGFGLLLTAILVCLVRFVDVQPIGPEGTRIGLAALNGAVFETFGVSMTWYKLTTVLGIVALLSAGLFALLGLYQLIRRKSLKKVDRELYVLAGLYVVTVILYVLFDKIAVNYRPTILPDETAPEASFPSSHTMLVCVVMGSAMTLLPKYVKMPAIRIALTTLCAVVLGLTVAGRLISGAHWFTDIIGGIFISITLLALYNGTVEALNAKEAMRHSKRSVRR